MARAYYKHNYRAFGEAVLRAEAMEAHMRARAEKIKARFEETAPVGAPYEHDDHAGRYRDSCEIGSGTEGGLDFHRAYARVNVMDPAAMQIEFGHTAEFDEHGKPARHGEGVRSVYVEGSHTLTRAVDAARDA